MSYNIKQVIVMRTDLNMRKGKMCAQAAHASLATIFKSKITIFSFLILRMNPYLRKWLGGSFAKIVVGIGSEKELILLYDIIRTTSKIPVSLIIDNGSTEFNGVKTSTCIGIGPWDSKEIDIFTGSLKLL